MLCQVKSKKPSGVMSRCGIREILLSYVMDNVTGKRVKQREKVIALTFSFSTHKHTKKTETDRISHTEIHSEI